MTSRAARSAIMSARPRRILVTGGTGFIGSWSALALWNAGWTVAIFDRRDDDTMLSRIGERNWHRSLTRITGDIRDPDTVHHAVKTFEPSVILHLAATLIPACHADPSNGARVNVVGLVNVFEAARARGVERIVYASSAAAHVRDESGALSSLYGAYKLAGEEIAKVYWSAYRLPSVGLTPSVVYGYGRGDGSADGGGMTAVATQAIVAAIRGEAFSIPLAGKYRFESVEEVADVIEKCATGALRGAFVSDITTTETSVEDFVRLLRKAFPQSRVTASARPTKRRYSPPDNRMLRAQIGEWQNIDLTDGVIRMAKYIASSSQVE
jgi:UDP-glucose 4-epimerase